MHFATSGPPLKQKADTNGPQTVFGMPSCVRKLLIFLVQVSNPPLWPMKA